VPYSLDLNVQVVQEQVVFIESHSINKLYHLGWALCYCLSGRSVCYTHLRIVFMRRSECFYRSMVGGLKALAAAKTTSQLVLEAMKALMDLSIHNCVRLLWVPGHSDIVGNEEADKLAKQAAAAEYIGPEPAFGFSTIAVRSKVQQWAHNEHHKHWFDTEGCRQAK